MVIFFAEALETFVADLQRAQPTYSSRCQGPVAPSSSWGVFTKMPAEARPLAWPAIIGKLIGKKVLRGLGLDSVEARRQRWRRSWQPSLPGTCKLGLNLVEGCGMTEDFAYSNTSSIRAQRPGYVGSRCRASPASATRGEVLISHLASSRAAYKQPELNAGMLHRGWLLPHRRSGRGARMAC